MMNEVGNRTTDSQKKEITEMHKRCRNTLKNKKSAKFVQYDAGQRLVCFIVQTYLLSRSLNVQRDKTVPCLVILEVLAEM